MGRKAQGKGTGKTGPRSKRSEIHIEDFSGLRRKGDEITRYANDPLGGNQQAHSIVKKYRTGWAPRKIAKRMSIPLATVEDAIRKVQR